MVDGKSFNDTYTQAGVDNASYVGCYDGGVRNNCPANSSTAHSRAHLYGEKIQRTPCGFYNTIDEVVKYKHGHTYYCSRNATNPEFTYRFKEYNPRDLETTYPLFTNRIITASAGECFVYPRLNKTGVPDVEGKGPGSIFTYGNNTFTGEIQIPQSSLRAAGTTYMYKGIQAPDHTEHRCGPRCMWLWAFMNGKLRKKLNIKEPPTFYKCPITINQVSNAWNDSQMLPDEVARIAAVSIALQGRWSGKLKNQNFNQYQFYPYGHLEVHWAYVVALFMGIVTTHLVLLLSTSLAIRKVAIKDDSFLAIARLLLPLVSILGSKGTLLHGKELAEAIHGKRGRGVRVVFGPKKDRRSRNG
ncbi:MAG: hypothetical protein Q9207_004128 [Kuettlingeria erythrocarpa]